MKIGILALQGNYLRHKLILDILGTDNIYVRYKQDIESCDGLIIPGGESTTISKQIDNNNLREVLREYSKTNSVFGTCAGLILLSSNETTNNFAPLDAMDFTVIRNAWGRQIDSFSDDVKLNFDERDSFHAVFIRAPKILSVGKNIKVLANYKMQPVMITDGKHYASSFHPEIGTDFRIHEYFLKHIND